MKTKTMIVAAVALALLAGMGVFAVANTVEYTGSGTPMSASGIVTARAVINPFLEMTITTPDADQSVDFGPVDPGTVRTDTVLVEIASNRLHTLTTAITGDRTELGFSNDMPTAVGVLPRTASTIHTDTYTIDVPWETEPRVTPYEALVTYTVTQQ